MSAHGGESPDDAPRGRDDLSAKAVTALPRIRRHIEAAKVRREWEALFVRRGPKCWPLRHRWHHYGLFASHKVCLTCGVAR